MKSINDSPSVIASTLTEKDVRRIFKEMLHEYETDLNVWVYRTALEGLVDRLETYQKHIDESLLTDENPDRGE